MPGVGDTTAVQKTLAEFLTAFADVAAKAGLTFDQTNQWKRWLRSWAASVYGKAEFPLLAAVTKQQRQRVAVAALAAGQTRDLAVSWPAPFADAAYTVAVAVEGGNACLWVSVKNPTAQGLTLTVRNPTGVLGLLGAPLAATVHVTATHD